MLHLTWKFLVISKKIGKLILNPQPPQKCKKIKPPWTKTSSVSVSTDVMAPKGKWR